MGITKNRATFTTNKLYFIGIHFIDNTKCYNHTNPESSDNSNLYLTQFCESVKKKNGQKVLFLSTCTGITGKIC